MKNWIYFCLILVVFFGKQLKLKAQSNNKTPMLEINGFVRNFTGLSIKTGDYSILQNTLDLKLKHQSEKVSFYANPYVYQYSDSENTFDLREMYIDFFSDKLDIRVGKQQIIWGQADGVFITDIISPKDLTEFLLRDFNEIRQGVTAVKLNYYHKDDHSFEFVFIPTFSSTILPKSDSPWRPKMSFPIQPTFDYSEQEVSKSLKNSEMFVRYSISKSAYDLQFMGGYSWDDDPSMHFSKTFELNSETGQPQLTALEITPKHHRLALTGMSFNTDIKGVIVRGEAALYFNKHFQTSNSSAKNGLTKKNYLNYVIGLDKSFGDWKISTQFIQKSIFNHNQHLSEEKIHNLATFMVSRTLMREKIRLEAFSYVGFTNKDAYIRLRGYYYPSDGISLEVGTNIFLGTKGQFGQFNENDMIFSRLKYSF